MIKPLSIEAQSWVDSRLQSLPLKACVAQILMPSLGGDYANIDDIERHINDGIALGGIFTAGASAARHSACISRLQALSEIPLVVAADLERGPGPVIQDRIMFPDPLAVAAADDEDWAHAMGKAAALEGRSLGIHWTFAPVADVNLNPGNPIANTRSLGDDPVRISRLMRSILLGMQDHGLAACAKHFPGDGVDCVDQHIVTSYNSLPMDQWKETFGKTFGAAIEASSHPT